MTKTRVIGDIHGHKYELSLILDSLPVDITEVIQVGDLGIGFGQGDYWHESLDIMFSEVNGRFLRGNHDNPKQCKQMQNWISDGSVRNSWMFVGGAWSIDKAWRTPGLDWWEDEELSMQELELIITTYDIIRPDVLITHDVAANAAEQLFFSEGRPLHGNQKYKTRTAQALQAMFEIHQPKINVFGHWHFDVDEVINGTRFICLNELSYCDIDRETLEVTFPSYWRPLT
jgi:predicted phosphodiesterase